MKDAAAAMGAKHPGKEWIETHRGRRFDLRNPVFDSNDIAHALGNMCRFGGHCRQFYSVAEHSLLVASLVSHLTLGDPFEALMHDAHEAYVTDLPAPWKAVLPEYKVKLEMPLELKLRVHFGFQPTISDGVKFADWVALMIEARWLLTSKGQDWDYVPPGVRECANQLKSLRVNCWTPDIAKDHWRAAYAELIAGRGLDVV